MGLEDIKKEIEKVEKEISNIPNKKNWYNFIHNSEIDSQKIKLENQLKELNEQLKAEQENEEAKSKIDKTTLSLQKLSKVAKTIGGLSIFGITTWKALIF